MIAHHEREGSPAKARDRSPIHRPRFIKALLLGMFVLCMGCVKQPPPPPPANHTPSAKPVVAQTTGVVETARKNIGIPYKFGGTSPETGFDCSGLVCWTFAQTGVDVPRTAREQLAYGQRIDKDSLEPGDIVVFKGTRSRTGWHSGIYTGESKFIHSPTRGKTVMESSLDEKYFAQRFIGASRIPRDGSAAALYAAYQETQRQEANSRRIAKKTAPAKASGKKNLTANAKKRAVKPAAAPAQNAKGKETTPLRTAAVTTKTVGDKKAAEVVDKLRASKPQPPAARAQARQGKDG